MGTLYFEDDSFGISGEIEKMSDEERHEQMRIWEEGRKEREKIKQRKTLLAI